MLREGPGHPDRSCGHQGAEVIRSGVALGDSWPSSSSTNSGDSCSYSLGSKGFMDQG